MGKSKKWLLAVGAAALLAVNGVVMAATSDDKQTTVNFPGRCAAAYSDAKPWGGMRHFREDHTALLELLKIDDTTFQSERRVGKPLVAIAEEHGVSEQQLKDFMLDRMNKRVDEAVKAGRLTEEQAKARKANFEEHINDIINAKGPMNGNGPMKGPMHGPGMFQDAELLALLKIDADTLRSERRAGKPLVAIAEEHGVSEQQLKDFMLDRMNKRVDEAVKAGRLTEEQAKARKANFEEHVNYIINAKGPMGGYGPMNGKGKGSDGKAPCYGPKAGN